MSGGLTWRGLTGLVEAAGLMDAELGHVHVLSVLTDGASAEATAEDWGAIEVFLNQAGTVSVMNSTCGRGSPSWERPAPGMTVDRLAKEIVDRLAAAGGFDVAAVLAMMGRGTPTPAAPPPERAP